jgi:hypothetical protein
MAIEVVSDPEKNAEKLKRTISTIKISMMLASIMVVLLQ